DGGEEGHVNAALRLEGGKLVEVREGSGGRTATGFVFDTPQAAAAAWEPDGAGLWAALRAALLEPRPDLSDRPVPPLSPLPAPKRTEDDRYLLNLEKPPAASAEWEEGDLAAWRALASATPAGYGVSVSAADERRFVFAWPAARQEALEKACRATLERRAGRVEVVGMGDAREFRVGPD